MTEIEYEVREQDLIAFNEHQLKDSERVQKTINRHQAMVPAVFFVIAMVLLFYFKDIPSSIYVGLIAAAWGVLVPLYLRWNIRKQLHRMITEEEKASSVGRHRLRVEQGSLVEVHSGGESKLPWSKVLRIEAEKKYAFIFIGLDSALIVPRATVSTGNLHEFVKAVDERIEQAG
ncbi:MAG: YcxB family protein [Methylococcaceae bacterium]|nr:YcxB family protein [Methylococcaceae bacterium]